MIHLRPSTREELKLFAEFETEEDVRENIKPHSLSEHISKFEDECIRYVTILRNDEPVGFFLLCLEDDAVEFRRVVVTHSARGIGQRAIELMHSFCADELDIRRIWLDVFEYNKRRRYIHSKTWLSDHRQHRM
jgi:RimJ/RimL family protein N-acetyltransferase